MKCLAISSISGDITRQYQINALSGMDCFLHCLGPLRNNIRKLTVEGELENTETDFLAIRTDLMPDKSTIKLQPNMGKE